MSPLSKSNVALQVAVFIIIIAGVMYASSIITPLLMALFISIVCAHPIQWMKQRKIPQGIAILVVFLGVIAVFLGFAELVGTSLSNFTEQAPVYEKNLKEMGASSMEFFRKRGMDISTDKMTGLFDPSKIMGFTAGFLSQLGDFMGNAFTIFFLVLFLLLELDSLSVKARAVVLDSSRSFDYIDRIGNNIRHYLSIKTFTSLLTGVFIWIALAVIGVDYAIIWALIAFLLNYIPNIGSILAAVPAVLFASLQLGIGGAVGTAIVFLVVNVIVGNAVEPKLMGEGMGLSTFVVFFSLLFWGFIMGTVGMFLSVPLTMSIKIMLEQSPDTKPIAIFLGTQKEAQQLVDSSKKVR